MNLVFHLRQRTTVFKQLLLVIAGATAAAHATAAQREAPAPTANADVSASSPADSASSILNRVNANEIQVNRYTTLSATPEESAANPLAVIAKVHFPRGIIVTVGDAIRYLLIRTGYELGDVNAMDDRVRRLFSLRLPESQRVMGPYRVDTMLQALMGESFNLVADPSTRFITYVVKDAHHQAPPTADAPLAQQGKADPAKIAAARASAPAAGQ